MIFVWCVLWPSLEFIAPNFTYTYGSSDAHKHSLIRVLRTIKVGDSSAALRRRYPAIFQDSFNEGGDGFSSISGGGATDRCKYSYSITVNQKTGLVDDVSCDVHERN